MGSCRKNRRHRPAFAGLANSVGEVRKVCGIEDPHGKPGRIPWNDLFRKKLESIHTANRTKGGAPFDGAVMFKIEIVRTLRKISDKQVLLPAISDKFVRSVPGLLERTGFRSPGRSGISGNCRRAGGWWTSSMAFLTTAFPRTASPRPPKS